MDVPGGEGVSRWEGASAVAAIYPRIRCSTAAVTEKGGGGEVGAGMERGRRRWGMQHTFRIQST